MKYTILLFSLILLNSCSNSQIKRNNIEKTIPVKKACTEDFNSRLVNYSNNFNPSAIQLHKSLSIELDSFLINTDSSCLRQQREYKLFTTIILLKLYYHHLRCCNQGYDLLSMKNGGAAVIINEFIKLIGAQNRRMEMLNSGVIVNFAENDSTMEKQVSVRTLISQIHKEVQRIDKGNL